MIPLKDKPVCYSVSSRVLGEMMEAFGPEHKILIHVNDYGKMCGMFELNTTDLEVVDQFRQGA